MFFPFSRRMNKGGRQTVNKKLLSPGIVPSWLSVPLIFFHWDSLLVHSTSDSIAKQGKKGLNLDYLGIFATHAQHHLQNVNCPNGPGLLQNHCYAM
jgi:hypothetical protein